MADHSEGSAVAKFVSQKLSKIRWKPSPGHVLHKSTTFASGSWDDARNTVGVWSVGDGSADRDMEEEEQFPRPPGEPSCLCEAQHPGSVSDLVYLPQDMLLVSSSRGSVHLYKHHINSQTLSVASSWAGLHHYGDTESACRGLAVRGRGDDTFASVGEDGRIHIVNLERRVPVSTIERGDSCSINGATFLKHSELATVNSSGQLKVWDLRQQPLVSAQPASTFLPSTSEHIALHCISKHPTQPHLVATGGEDGALCLWDMRRDKFPVTMLSAHSSHMWEVHFHPSYPNNLFTCSNDGSVWHWDANKLDLTPTPLLSQRDPSTHEESLFNASKLNLPSSKSHAAAMTPWLACEAGKSRLDITDLLGGNTLPVNSIDICDNTLLCATDAEQIIAVQNLLII